MPHYINHLLLALLLLTTACTSDDSMPNGIIQGPVNDKAQAVYEGNWTIGNYNAGTAEMTASSSGFSFGTIPFAAILRMAMPHSNVSCDNTTGFVVPYTETGISDQAIYMQLNSSMWSTPATIDDQNVTARIYFASPFNTQHRRHIATYSRLSGNYTMTLYVARVELADNEGQTVRTVEADLTMTFATTRRTK